MNEVVIDKSQIIGEVKERNKFYKALVKVRDIANKAQKGQQIEPITSLNEIEEICEEALKNII